MEGHEYTAQSKEQTTEIATNNLCTRDKGVGAQCYCYSMNCKNRKNGLLKEKA